MCSLKLLNAYVPQYVFTCKYDQVTSNGVDDLQDESKIS